MFSVLQTVAWLAAAALSTARQAVYKHVLGAAKQLHGWQVCKGHDEIPVPLPVASTAVSHVSLDRACYFVSRWWPLADWFDVLKQRGLGAREGGGGEQVT